MNEMTSVAGQQMEFPGIPQAIITAVVNRKGGVGKTFLSWLLASSLVRSERYPVRVLLVDLDAQTNATFLADPSADALDTAPTVLDLMLDVSMGHRVNPESAVLASPQGYDLLAATTHLKRADRLLIQDGEDNTRYLREVLNPLRTRYDFIFLDCPPSNGIIVENALCAADQVLVPCDRTSNSLNGLEDVQRQRESLNAQQLSAAQMNGAVITNATTRSRASKENLAQQEQMIDQMRVFRYPTIRSMDIVPDAINDCVPVLELARTGENHRIVVDFVNAFYRRALDLQRGGNNG